ncbi:MAG: PhnD/SsuA/transferrin family substrate-binding protein [Elioraea sp.]|nr:PhnD/SsuA/transferrin family substrate-binding protein [Elioraea sp.]
MIRRALLALLLAAASSPLAAQQRTAISLAVTDVAGLEALQRDYGPFKAAFERLSGLEIRFFPVSSRTAAVEAMAAGRVDLVLTGPSEYVVFRARIPQVMPLIGFQRVDYFSNIVVRADSPFQVPADLKGRRVAFQDVGSTSRHLGPAQVLADHGVDPRRDVQTLHTSLNTMVEALRRGDVAAIGVNHTDIVRLRERMPDLKIRVIARGRDLPPDVVLAAPHLDRAVADRIREVFVRHERDLVDAIAATEANRRLAGMSIVPVDDAAYNYVRAMYRTIGQPQFADFVGE